MTAARIGIGGPVGSGKTALIEALIPVLTARGIDLAIITHDLVTEEDAERLRGGDIPRKRGPGVLRCDLLVVNKIDLAPHVGVDLPLMLAEAGAIRDGRPVLATDARHGAGVAAVADSLCRAVLFDR